MSWTKKESKVQSINVNDIAKRSILEWFTEAYDKRGNFENEELGRIYQIPVNPETGEYEHHGSKWLSLDQASHKLHPYLRPMVDWVREVIEEH